MEFPPPFMVCCLTLKKKSQSKGPWEWKRNPAILLIEKVQGVGTELLCIRVWMYIHKMGRICHTVWLFGSVPPILWLKIQAAQVALLGLGPEVGSGLYCSNRPHCLQDPNCPYPGHSPITLKCFVLHFHSSWSPLHLPCQCALMLFWHRSGSTEPVHICALAQPAPKELWMCFTTHVLWEQAQGTLGLHCPFHRPFLHKLFLTLSLFPFSSAWSVLVLWLCHKHIVFLKVKQKCSHTLIHFQYNWIGTKVRDVLVIIFIQYQVWC